MQKEKTVFYKSTLAASALFVMGNSVMVLPLRSANKYTFLCFILVAVITIILSGCIFPLSFAVLGKFDKTRPFFNSFKAVTLLMVSIAALFVAADTFKDFIYFVKEIILPETSVFIISVLFALTVAFFFFKRQEDSLKFYLLCLCFSVVAAVFFFVAMSKNFDFRNIFIQKIPNIDELKKNSEPYILKSALPSLILPFYHTAVFSKRAKSACVFGIGAGFILLGLCILPCILLFSPDLAGKLSYPYASAVSTVTVGKIFTRLDGFSYFLYFATALSRINICLFVAKKAVECLHSGQRNR